MIKKRNRNRMEPVIITEPVRHLVSLFTPTLFRIGDFWVTCEVWSDHLITSVVDPDPHGSALIWMFLIPI
jgi:hypothetical protein